VIVYHANATWLPGGFLGVEVFFVISGFIITRGLAHEWLSSGRISVTSFWMRRARRLLPALFVLLIGVLTYATFFDEGSLTKLRMDVLAAIGYFTNWHLIFEHESYFDSWNHPSFLRHLWSLAIEEQFYLLWPLLVFGALRLLRVRGAFSVIVLGAIASYTAMALLSQGRDQTEISRVYYGTDTRIGALLVGSVVGFLPFSERLQTRLSGSLLLGFLGYVSLGGLLIFAARLSDSASFLYSGGFVGVTLTTAVLILCLNNPASITSRLLAIRPLRWIGVRSYGIYLYHFPILLMSWPDMTKSVPLLLVQVGATFLVADISYRYIEQPIRRGALGRVYRSLTERRAGWRQGFAAGFVMTSVLIVGSGLGYATVIARPPEVPPYLQAGSFKITTPNSVAQDVASLVTTLSPPQTAEAGESAADVPPVGDSPVGDSPTSDTPAETPPEQPAATEQPSIAADEQAIIDRCQTIRGRDYESDEVRNWFLANCLGRQSPPPATSHDGPPPAPLPTFVATGTVAIEGGITAIGDSVMVGAGPWLAANFAGIDIDAQVGRQVSQAVALMQQKAADGTPAKSVVFHIGNNGTFTAGQFDQIMQIAGPDRQVYFMNVHVPRNWQDSNNAVIGQGTAYYPNAHLIDWQGTVRGHDELFASDGVHIGPQGASIYTGLILQALGH
jgi:peptidoglycan/LPS O-acetylase OafA/YrhL